MQQIVDFAPKDNIHAVKTLLTNEGASMIFKEIKNVTQTLH
jgi:hypothetical protein